MSENLLIVGASTRAAAFSALRAGLQPWCADLFADADLAARCRVLRVDQSKYPEAFVEIADQAPAGPWLYTGGLENRPRLVEKMARRRRLWGIVDSLKSLRDPAYLAWIMKIGAVPCPCVRVDPPEEEDPTTWLVKPLASAGGSGIYFWDRRPSPAQRVYFQEFIPGPSLAALFVGDHGARLLGATTQLAGVDWLRAAPFHYCGSVFRETVGPGIREALERIGNALTGVFNIRGLFGVDCILRDGVPYPVEVNPRYTASVEVLEYASGTSLLAQHRAVFEPTSQRLAFRARPALPDPVGKAILFAKGDLTFPSDGPWMPTLRTPGDIWDLPAFADIPHAGERIEKGKPILTFFARGPTEAAVLAALQATAADLERWLFRS